MSSPLSASSLSAARIQVVVLGPRPQYRNTARASVALADIVVVVVMVVAVVIDQSSVVVVVVVKSDKEREGGEAKRGGRW